MKERSIRFKEKEKKKTLPSQHLIFNIDNNLAAPREMRVWRRRLFEFWETSWSALLIQYLLLLKAFYLEPRFVPLIVNSRKYQHVQNQQTASDRDRHAQSCRIRGIPTKKKNINYLSFTSLSISWNLSLSGPSKTNTKHTLQKYLDRDLLNNTLPWMHRLRKVLYIFEFHHHTCYSKDEEDNGKILY